MSDWTCEEHIISELEKAGIDYSYNNKFIQVECPFHSHSGRKKHLGFARESRFGGMHCWVCGKEGGRDWNAYAAKMGLALIDGKRPAGRDTRGLLTGYQDDFGTNDRWSQLPPGTEPWTQNWRGLSAEFLSTIPTFRWWDSKSKGYRLLWPVIHNGKFLGCTSAAAEPDLQPKTRNLAKLPTSQCMFPFDHELVRSSTGVVLVEGQFDVLRLLSKGIPALSIMGVSQWQNDGRSGPFKKAALIGRGIKRVVIAMDGDDAGQVAAEKIHNTLYKDLDVRTMIFPKPPVGAVDEQGREITSYDPGNCPEKFLKLMKKMLR